MKNEDSDEFFHSSLGGCVMQLSIEGKEISINEIRKAWLNSTSLSNSDKELLLLKLTEIEASSSSKKHLNVVSINKDIVM